MTQDYFAHYAYGVLLEGEDEKKVLAAILEKPANIDPDEFDAELEEINNGSTILREMQKKYHAPEDSVLIHTGYDDDRPGCCGTAAEQFILGFGVYAFPDVKIQMSDQYKAKADWHSWVT